MQNWTGVVHFAELGKICTMHPDWSMGKHRTMVDAMQFSTWQNSTVQYSTVQYSISFYNKPQYSLVKFYTKNYSTACPLKSLLIKLCLESFPV